MGGSSTITIRTLFSFGLQISRYWSGAAQEAERDSPTFYIAVYAGITTVGVLLSTARWFVLYNGSIRASTVLYQRLLEAVLFADIRFHDTVSRGRLLNRFGKDFEGALTVSSRTVK